MKSLIPYVVVLILAGLLFAAGQGSQSGNVVNQGGAPWTDNITQWGSVNTTLGQKVAASSVPITESVDLTYVANIRALASATAATDIWTISGSGTKTILVTSLQLTCTQTTAGVIEIVVAKHSAADSGGTSTNPTVIPLDSNNAAGTAVVNAYTANPTVGTSLGNIDTAKIGCMATATASPNDIYFARYGVPYGTQPVVLRGTAQQLAVNLNSTTVAGGSFDITVTWIEQ